MTRIFATAMVAVGLSVLAPRLADAEVPEVKLVLQNGSNYLPLMVMQAQNLVEKHLAAKGLAGTTVTWAGSPVRRLSSIHSWRVPCIFLVRACRQPH